MYIRLIPKADRRSYCGRPFICAMILPQLGSESSVIASLLAIFSMHSGQANSSLRGARRSAPCEMTAPISLPHCLHRMFNGTNTAHPPFYEMHRPVLSARTFGNSARTSGRFLAKLACSIPTTWAPSPTAAATRFVEPERTSPIAKTPGRLSPKEADPH